eukprot:m.171616 g.171616  ORF g.171616 m.171616 type:complete len:291 (-) comp25184_c1_seq31:226-1098(-)
MDDTTTSNDSGVELTPQHSPSQVLELPPLHASSQIFLTSQQEHDDATTILPETPAPMRKRKKVSASSKKQLSCKEPGCSFKGNRPALNQHVNDEHNQVAKFPCKYCQKKYNKKSALTYHENKQHLDKVFEQGIVKFCPKCNEPFRTTSRGFEKRLQNHIDKCKETKPRRKYKQVNMERNQEKDVPQEQCLPNVDLSDSEETVESPIVGKVVNRLDRDLLHQAVPSLVFARRQAASSESGQEEEDETDEELESTPKKSFLNQSLLSQYGLPPEQLASLEALIQKEVEKRKQ